MASRTIAPSSDTKSAGRLKLFWLMVPMPKSGVSKNPASKAPITPTAMLRNTPLLRVCIHDKAGDPSEDASNDEPQNEIPTLPPFCCVHCAFFLLAPLPGCASVLCNTSDVKVPQPGCFSNVTGANVVPGMTVTAHPFILRE